MCKFNFWQTSAYCDIHTHWIHCTHTFALHFWGGFMASQRETHSVVVGYILWIFGFLGSHRFYFGKPVTGTIWFFTLGLLGIGWFLDLFFMPRLAEEANGEFAQGDFNYTIGWVLLTFLGVFGVHRFYLGKIGTGILYLLTAGLFGVGIIYDFWTFNDQVHNKNLGHD
jgi:TM2 domain-containing membrane protein YozV